MKKIVLITKKTVLIAAFIGCGSLFSQTNLVQNGTADDFQTETGDNADAWDMTPNSTVKLDADAGATSPSPYRAIWYNSDLDAWLAANCGDSDEQPGSSSDGNYVNGVKTRGVKISEKCRRLYQVISVTAGDDYTFSIESRSEAANVPSEVFILNTEITSETGLASTSTTVDAYLNITNDFNSSKSSATTDNFTTSTFDFTASGTKVVIYVRAPLAVDSSNEVFYDNISLIKKATTSVNDVFASKVSIYPNPTEGVVKISTTEEISSVAVYNLLGKKVLTSTKLANNSVDVSSLSKGLYLVKVTSGNQVTTKKIMKK